MIREGRAPVNGQARGAGKDLLGVRDSFSKRILKYVELTPSRCIIADIDPLSIAPHRCFSGLHPVWSAYAVAKKTVAVFRRRFLSFRDGFRRRGAVAAP
jgi:hypothetical protein